MCFTIFTLVTLG